MVSSTCRTVISGIGCLNALGASTAAFWEAALQGKSGIRPISLFDASGLPIRIAAELPGFKAVSFIPKEEKDLRKSLKMMARTIEIAVCAARRDDYNRNSFRLGVAGFDANADTFFGQIDDDEIAVIDFGECAAHQFAGIEMQIAPAFDVAHDAGRRTQSFQCARNCFDARAITLIGVIFNREEYFHPMAKLACP